MHVCVTGINTLCIITCNSKLKALKFLQTHKLKRCVSILCNTDEFESINGYIESMWNSNNVHVSGADFIQNNFVK